MKQNKSQASIEFLILFVFILIGIILMVFAVGKVTIGLSDTRSVEEINDVANSILIEFKILSDALPGYERSFQIEEEIVTRFNVTFIDEYLLLEDIDTFGVDGQVFYYDLPGEFNLSNVTFANGTMEINISKIAEFEPQGLDILIS